jgi:hypothetical protein
MTVDGQPPMADEQAVIVFLRQLDHALSDALGGDEQRRLRWLTVIHALVMAVLADRGISIRHSDRPPTASPSSTPDRSLHPGWRPLQEGAFAGGDLTSQWTNRIQERG